MDADLVADQDRESGAERQQVVDDAVEEQRGQDLLGSIELRELDQHHAFEDADASRHLAHHADELSRQERAEEHAERWTARRQQGVEHRGGEHPVEHRERELRERQAERRDGELEPAHPQRRQMDRGGRQVGDRHRQQRDTGAATQRPDPVPFDRRVGVEGEAPARRGPTARANRRSSRTGRRARGHRRRCPSACRSGTAPTLRRAAPEPALFAIATPTKDATAIAPAPDRLLDVDERELVVAGEHRVAARCRGRSPTAAALWAVKRPPGAGRGSGPRAARGGGSPARPRTGRRRGARGARHAAVES